MAKEVKQWITVNGHHVPIFEGESREEAVKRAVKKTQGTKKTGGKKEPVRKQLKNVPEVVQGKTASELHKKLEEQGLGMESADASSLHYRDFNDEEVSLYDAYGNEYRGVFTKGKGGGYEVTGIHKEWHNRKPTDTYSTGVKEKDEDIKEKQIARNKKEADERNGKTSGSNKYVGKETKMADDIGTKNLMDVPVGTVINSDGEKWKKVDKDVWSHGKLRWGSKDVYRQRLEGGDEVEFSYPSKGSVAQGVKNEKKNSWKR